MLAQRYALEMSTRSLLAPWATLCNPMKLTLGRPHRLWFHHSHGAAWTPQLRSCVHSPPVHLLNKCVRQTQPHGPTLTEDPERERVPSQIWPTAKTVDRQPWARSLIDYPGPLPSSLVSNAAKFQAVLTQFVSDQVLCPFHTLRMAETSVGGLVLCLSVCSAFVPACACCEDALPPTGCLGRALCSARQAAVAAAQTDARLRGRDILWLFLHHLLDNRGALQPADNFAALLRQSANDTFSSGLGGGSGSGGGGSEQQPSSCLASPSAASAKWHRPSVRSSPPRPPVLG